MTFCPYCGLTFDGQICRGCQRDPATWFQDDAHRAEFEERAAIKEFEGNMTRARAEAEAYVETRQTRASA